MAARRADDLSGVWLRPYMRSRRCKTGEVLFQKGDPATHLYFLDDGLIEVVETSTTMQPGELFGVIAFFAPTGDARSPRAAPATARC